MTVGLQTWDENGNLIIDLTSRCTRFLGRLDGVVSNGSLVDSRFADGTGFVMVLPDVTDSVPTSIYTVPQAEVVGNTLTWSFSVNGYDGASRPFTPIPCTILYGVY